MRLIALVLLLPLISVKFVVLPKVFIMIPPISILARHVFSSCGIAGHSKMPKNTARKR